MFEFGRYSQRLSSREIRALMPIPELYEEVRYEDVGSLTGEQKSDMLRNLIDSLAEWQDRVDDDPVFMRLVEQDLGSLAITPNESPGDTDTSFGLTAQEIKQINLLPHRSDFTRTPPRPNLAA
jgi:hypothetical protein